jgi:hypothetical protein
MESGGIGPSFLTSALDGYGWLASRLCRIAIGERASGIHCIGGWVGPRAGLGAVEERNILPYRQSNPGRPARSPSLYRLNYPGSLYGANSFSHSILFDPVPWSASKKLVIQCDYPVEAETIDRVAENEMSQFCRPRKGKVLKKMKHSETS